MIRKIFFLIIMLGFLISNAPAQEQSGIQSGDGKMDVFGETCDGCVTVDFRDADIRNVLQILSYRSGINIVAGPEVSGLVSIQLTNVPWENALDVILQTHGYGYEKKGNIVIVTTIENLKRIREDALILAEQESLETKTFLLSYANASEVILSIEKMLTSRGSVNFDQRTNTIIVTDTITTTDLIGQVINKLDATTPQVLIEAKIIETNFTDAENLGIDWILKASAGGSTRPTYWPFTESSSNKYVQTLDFPSPAGEWPDDSGQFSFGTLNFSQVQAVMEFLKSRSSTHILSNPRIVTLDNQTANIVVGTQYPLPQYTYNEEQAKLQVSGWEYKDIGIIFEVTPNVNNSELVTLTIEPKITAILDYVQVENTSLPRLSTESASTRVMIKDGETLVIAGLVKNQWLDIKKKVPFLGDIPILGYAFQKKEKTLTKTELLIFITPHIVTGNAEDDSQFMKEKLTEIKM